MSNPLFSTLGGGIPQGNGPMQMIQQFMQFKQNFKGDPKAEVEKMLQSALLTTAMASQTQQLINAINPAPIPAYQVPNPNTFYGCGCNTGCNC